ncbi:asparagine synthase (glutamine-hydrolyzing) [uncultured Pseudodesulfovibrio sp.]|uniref:asparagine synthase (glutamine-hydrolyzing) n=1 Tax=uncultured Pseudodesulfovibrio sp. TaxID=2035858 RepID=UPI0029C6EF22|nr:asparagine synthase (glutamine-hydrolyzing) [uncultured Pseudodesulfovibrio sp.]
MCGITGFISTVQTSAETQESIIRSMTDTLSHRGPDSSGTLCFPESGVALGHARLAILELSPLGHQPMLSTCKRYSIVYNGEVYNHLSLRPELEQLGHHFRSTSDTETILAAIAQWGLQAVNRFIGMFAFALWDREKRELTLVRDRLGIKPLYYRYAGGACIFGSELKALKAHPDFKSTIDRNSLAVYFRHNYIPAPHSIYQDTHKLSPGTMLTVSEKELKDGKHPEPVPYWSAFDAWKHGQDNPLSGSEEEIANQLEDLISDAVKQRMLSDVPLGAFLSGGIDSSLVAALMQKGSTNSIKTFSIGFENQTYNEAPHAKAVAQHLGTDHTELYVSTADVLSSIPKIPTIWDEPFADSSQIPTYCLSKLTRKHVTVSLSGDGGDELFAGYTRYTLKGIWDKLRRIPLPLRQMASKFEQLPDALFSLFGNTGAKIHRRLNALGCSNFNDFYRYILSHNTRPSSLVLGSNEYSTHLQTPAGLDLDSAYSRMTYWDTVMYLPDDILTKVDRASMAVSLEARVPLLDHRIVELAARVPMQMKIQGTDGKRILKKILYRHVPRTIVDRPKMGFGIPFQDWLRSDLRDWAHELLSPARIRQQGYLDATAVNRMWTSFLKGHATWQYHLWDILVFQSWLENAEG